LGLSISARLVEMMGGQLRCVSEPGRGSTFSFAADFGLAKAPVETEAGAGALTVPAGRLRCLRVLVAEDNSMNQEVVLTLLRREGHAATLAQNGREALDLLETDSFDIVLMDVQMPELDGLSATAAIRERERAHGGRIPIVAMTAHAMTGDRERCLAAGMDAYVSKPIHREELLRTMQNIAGAPRGPAGASPEPERLARQGGQRAPLSGRAQDPKPAPREFALQKARQLDETVALSRMGGDRELLLEIARLFLEDYPNLLAAIQHAISGGDASALEHGAHTLKGSVANFGAAESVEAALRLEMMGRDGALQDSSDAFRRLESALARLRAELESLGSQS
ncbi:MAG: response regulator, partial [Bryobacteraceae bacterium]